MTIASSAAMARTLSEVDDAVSQGFVEARLNAKLLSEFPARLPKTLEQAYAIQSASIERWPDPIGGWKVARLPVPDRERFATERLVGPVFASTIREVQADSCTTVPIYEGGFAAIEAEFILVLGKSVPASGRDYSQDELANLVADVYAGVEIASSPLPTVIEFGATSIISDFGVNAGVVIGPEIADWRSREKVSASVTVDDVVVGETTTGAITADPLDALRALINLSANRGYDLAKGTIVSAGMLTGVHEVTPDSKVRVDFGAVGRFDLAFEPMLPRN